MITDDQLVELSKNLDNTLANLSLQYQISPLSLAAVVLARLIHLADHSGDIYALMAQISSGEYSKTERTIQ